MFDMLMTHQTLNWVDISGSGTPHDYRISIEYVLMEVKFVRLGDDGSETTG